MCVLRCHKSKHHLGHWENWGSRDLPMVPNRTCDRSWHIWIFVTANQGAKVLRNHLSKLLRVQAGQQTIFASQILFGWTIVGICWYDISAWYYQSLSKSKAGTRRPSFWFISHMSKHSWHTENDMRERMIEAFCLPIPVGLWLPLPPSRGLLWFWNGQGFMIWDEICRIW